MPQPAPPLNALALTDDQMSAVLRAAQPLDRGVREAFLQALAHELRTCGALGDGRVFRAIAEVQRRYWDPPVASGHGRAHAGKYARG
jgi:hypothetical protein